jgi:hypothetical protein
VVSRGIDNIKKRRGEATTDFVLKMAALSESASRPPALPVAAGGFKLK